jgi:hypothetical protein
MRKIIVIEVGKNYSNFENIAYCKCDGYCLISILMFKAHIKSILGDSFTTATVLSMTLGIHFSDVDTIIQINKL